MKKMHKNCQLSHTLGSIFMAMYIKVYFYILLNEEAYVVDNYDPSTRHLHIFLDIEIGPCSFLHAGWIMRKDLNTICRI